MSTVFHLSADEAGNKSVVVFSGGKLHQATDAHPSYQQIVNRLVAGAPEEDIVSLFDVATAIRRAFQRLSERVTVEGETVYFDGDPAQEGLSKQILRFMDEGQDFGPLVNFMEKIETNPIPHSKQQAWDWLNQHDFTIYPDGDVMAYKGVYDDGKGGYRSGSSGHAFVNDEEVNGYVPNSVGDIVTMIRSEVVHDPASACHAGLHVGTYEYARFYAQGALLKVKINPRDIVSVPTQDTGQKIRVCRYEVMEIIDAPETRALAQDRDDDSAGGYYSLEDIEVNDTVLSHQYGECLVIDVDVFDEDGLPICIRTGFDQSDWVPMSDIIEVL